MSNGRYSLTGKRIFRISVFYFFLFSFITVPPLAAQLKADFSADITEGCAPLIVRFTDLSTGNPVSYRWMLGNNITPHADKNPSTTYLNPGVYTVKLIVRNAANTVDSVEKTSYIKVYASPVVNFKASDSTGCFPVNISFTDVSTPGDGVINKWLWDFGDGITSTETNPSHEYTARGNYHVTLRVTNSHGCEKTFAKPEYIRLTSGVKADFNFQAPNTCRAPATITLNNNSTGTGTLSYSWIFGDGTTSTAINPVHTYTTGGSYSIQLVTINDAGCSDTLKKGNAITIGTVKAALSAPAEVCAGSIFEATNASAPAAAGSHWDFGDGTSSNSLHANKSYTQPGTYTITLTSNFGACTDVTSQQITVLPKPVAAFTTSGTVSCNIPFTVTFTNQSTDAVSYSWNFGDGSTSIGKDPVYIYGRSGRFTVTLTATGANGCSASNSSHDLVKAEPLDVRLLNLPQKACAPYTYKPEIYVNAVEPIAAYEWDFGDGTTSTEASPVHTYPNAGNYTVKLVVTTTGGCKDSAIVMQGIQLGQQPVVNFSATTREVCAFTTVDFTDLSSGIDINEWFWEFGDGTSSRAKNPMHTYTDTGYFAVLLTVGNNGCRNTISTPVMIHILPPIARFQVKPQSCDAPFTREFTDVSIGALSWLWNFGDGTTSTEQHPKHIYQSTGTYTVTLTVKNDTCEHRMTSEIRIIDEKANLITAEPVICKHVPLALEIGNVNTDNIQSVNWAYGDGHTEWLNGDKAHHSYNKNGQFNIRAIVYDRNGCSDTLRNTVSVKGPVADFVPVDNTLCKEDTVTFTDLSTPYQSIPIVNWIWSFGDGKRDTLSGAPFRHQYTGTGYFSVQLRITDAEGCTDNLFKTNPVYISKPDAGFTSPDTLSCYMKDIRFINQSSGSRLTYNWDFGDNGASSEAIQPVYAYGEEGSYEITLTVTDTHGCLDTMSRRNYIQIRNPKASFAVNDSVTTCPPLFSTFKNTSANFTSYKWDFGDRTSSSIDDPTHFYNYPGEYTAQLIVTSAGGCSDTSEKKMVVRGPQGEFFYSDTVACVPATITFRGTTRDQVTFVWDFNDGNTQMTADSSISYTYNLPGIYYPKMILVDPQGCKVPIGGTEPLHLKGVTAKFDVSSAVLCDSGVVQLTDQSLSQEKITGYSWNFGDGQTSTVKNPRHYFTAPGEYPVTLRVTTETGCTDAADLPTDIVIASRPEIDIAGTTELCAPASFQFAAKSLRQDSTGLRWAWVTGNGIADTSSTFNISFNAAGNEQLMLTGTSGWGCTDTVVRPLAIHPIPQLDAGADAVVCLGEEYTLHARGADIYKWTTTATLSCADCPSPVVKPDNNMIVHLEGRSLFGCRTHDSLHIEVKKPFRVNVKGADTICTGAEVQLTASGSEKYKWSPASGLTSSSISSPRASPSVTTVYELVGYDTHGCFFDTARVPIVVYAYPVVNAGDDKTILVGNAVELETKMSPDVTKIRWTPAAGLDCLDCLQPVANPKQTTTYGVQVANQGGCTSMDDVTVHVLCNQGNVFLPNTFSPNGDGNNDVFYPRGKGVYGIRTLRIFNRWGELVFERHNFQANDSNSGWDGKVKGIQTGQDVYVYTIDIICENNTVMSLKGNVALIR